MNLRNPRMISKWLLINEHISLPLLRMYTRFYALFYGKKKVSAKTLLIFIFYCGTVSRENWRKNYGSFVNFIGIKNETDCSFMS